MKISKTIATGLISTFMGLTAVAGQGVVPTPHSHGGHEMQHGFVLAADDQFASHLVANGPHSRQTEVTGNLTVDDPTEMEFYQLRKRLSSGSTYFLFQAQGLDLENLATGQILSGHIVESQLGKYEPKNKIVRSAFFRIEKILINIVNPFFTGEFRHPSSGSKTQFFEDAGLISREVNSNGSTPKHCCETGRKPCWWKC